jgi:hypothetical protein
MIKLYNYYTYMCVGVKYKHATATAGGWCLERRVDGRTTEVTNTNELLLDLDMSQLVLFPRESAGEGGDDVGVEGVGSHVVREGGEGQVFDASYVKVERCVAEEGREEEEEEEGFMHDVIIAEKDLKSTRCQLAIMRQRRQCLQARGQEV